ncbi:hypothetical protein Tco_1061166 [Tanacetum coccineum]
MTTKAQQSTLDNALVAPENQRVIGKCNMRINPRIKPKEPTYQVVLDALALTTCYPAFLITAEVPVIYMHQFWAIVNKHNASYRFKIDNKRFSMNVEVFREILNICPRIPGQEFNEPPSEVEALSFILELGHFREIKYITDVIVDHLHQPWRTFASIINKCLCGKDLAYQIDNKDSKKQGKIFYQRHTAQDDSLLGTMRFVSRHEDTQVYGAILPKSMTNQAMLDSKSTKAKKDVPSTKKPATKPRPIKKKAPIKADRGKSLNVLSEVALSEAAQLNEITKRSKKDFHISHANKGTGAKPGVPDVPKYDSESDKESWNDSGEEDDDEDNTEDDEGNDDGDDSDGNDDDDNDNDDDDDDDDNDEQQQEEEHVDEFTDKEDDVNNANEENEEGLDNGEELYKDVNVNLRKEDVEMTDAD